MPAASRPRICSFASTTYHSRVMSVGLAEKVFMRDSGVLVAGCASAGGGRFRIDRRGLEPDATARSKVDDCTTRQRGRSTRGPGYEVGPRRPKKKRRLADGAEDSTIGGEWRNWPAVPKEEID